MIATPAELLRRARRAAELADLPIKDLVALADFQNGTPERGSDAHLARRELERKMRVGVVAWN